MNTTELKDPSVAPIRDTEAGDASLTRGADNSLVWTKVAHELTQAEIDAQADVKGLINPSKVTFGGGSQSWELVWSGQTNGVLDLGYVLGEGVYRVTYLVAGPSFYSDCGLIFYLPPTPAGRNHAVTIDMPMQNPSTYLAFSLKKDMEKSVKTTKIKTSDIGGDVNTGYYLTKIERLL